MVREIGVRSGREPEGIDLDLDGVALRGGTRGGGGLEDGVWVEGEVEGVAAARRQRRDGDHPRLWLDGAVERNSLDAQDVAHEVASHRSFGIGHLYPL